MRFELNKKPWNDMNRMSLVCRAPSTIISPITGDIMVNGDDKYIIKELQGDYLLVDKIDA